MEMAPPKTTAAIVAMTATHSIALTVGSMLKPCSSTTRLSPTHSATTAASTMRRVGGISPSSPGR
jgi:hypothetical protein